MYADPQPCWRGKIEERRDARKEAEHDRGWRGNTEERMDAKQIKIQVRRKQEMRNAVQYKDAGQRWKKGLAEICKGKKGCGKARRRKGENKKGGMQERRDAGGRNAVNTARERKGGKLERRETEKNLDWKGWRLERRETENEEDRIGGRQDRR